MPSFRVEVVDKVIWDWVVKLLTDPEALQEGINARLSRNEEESNPLKERLAIAEDMLEDNKSQLDRLVDLYVSGDFPKDVLLERKNRLENSIQALEKERLNIIAALERNSLTPKQIDNIYEFAKQVGKGLQSAQDDPDYKRKIIEALDLRVIFAVEEGKKVLYAQCVLGEEPEKFGIPANNTLLLSPIR